MGPEDRARSFMLLSFCSIYGYGVPVDFEKSLSYCRSAAEGGLTVAKAVLPRYTAAILPEGTEDATIEQMLSSDSETDRMLGEVEFSLKMSRAGSYCRKFILWEKLWRDECQRTSFKVFTKTGHESWCTAETLRSDKYLPIYDLDAAELEVIFDTRFCSMQAPLLHYVAEMGWLDVMDRLLGKAGLRSLSGRAEPNPGTFLFAAITSSQTGMSLHLIEQGALASFHQDIWHVSSVSGISPFHLLFFFENDEDLTNMAAVFDLERENPNAIITNACFIYSYICEELTIELAGTPLDVVVRMGDIRAVNALLQYGGDPLLQSPGTLTMNPRRPLDLAIALHQFDVVELLLSHIEDTGRLPELNGSAQESPLHHISGYIYKGKNLMARWLLHGSESKTATHKTIQVCIDHGIHIDSLDSQGNTPLIWACMRGPCQSDVVSALLSYGADVNVVDPEGRAALALSSHSLPGDFDNTGSVVALLEYGAKLNHQDQWGRTALHWFAEANALAALKVLIDAGADLDLPANNGETPMKMAIRTGAYEAAELLINCGSDMDQLTLIEGHSYETTAAAYAVIVQQASILTLLLGKGASISMGPSGRTLLHIACYQQNLEALRMFLGKYRNRFCVPEVLQSIDEDDSTALHLAAMYDNPVFAHELLLAGAEIDYINPDEDYKWYRTAVAVAIYSGNYKTLTFLVESGASPYCRGENRELSGRVDLPRFSFLAEAIHAIHLKGYEERFKELLSRTRTWIDKSDVLVSRDLHGWTVLHYAIYRARLTCVKALLEIGASTADRILEVSEDVTCQRWKGCDAYEFAENLQQNGRMWDDSTKEERDAWSGRLEQVIAYLNEVKIEKYLGGLTGRE